MRKRRNKKPRLRRVFNFYGEGGQKEFVKGERFSNENPFILGVSGGRNTVGTRAAARRYPTERATPKKRGLGRKTEREGFALHKFPDGNFARARPRCVRLSAYGLKLTQCCGLQIPTQHQAVGVAPKKVISKSKTRGFFQTKTRLF